MPESPAVTAPSPDLFAEVVFDRPLRRSYHYRVPERLRASLPPGARVRVSFGRQADATGYCVGLVDKVDLPPARIKDVLEVLDAEPLLSPLLLKLTEQVAAHYGCSWGQALQAALPRGVRAPGRGRTLRVVELARPPETLQAWIREHRGGRRDKQTRVLRVLLEEVQGDVTPFELSSMCGVSRSVLGTLAREGFIRFAERSAAADPLAGPPGPVENPLRPNEEQQKALGEILERVRSGEFTVFLVQGVTGSGKTEIYLQAIDEVVRAGRQAIVLVPEISLTPQTVQRFRARFSRLAVLHSRQTESQRRDQWLAIRKAEASVVIGARSAVFAPVPRLGLIVVDEEHENSFKQENVPRYHARDVAVLRARIENAVVLLGSATPSLESYHNWRTGKYRRVVLRSRVEDRPLPEVEILDMNVELAGAKYWNFLSRRLRHLMDEALGRQEQVLLFLNRRGFSTHAKCPRCGHVLTCGQCSAAMTYYERRHLAVCLHCRKEIEPPDLCPACLVGKMRYLGIGTEKVEEESRKLFPGHRVARMDSDTMRGHDAYERVFGEFREGRIRVLVGTQMISKGLDLPNVTVVGVVSADTSRDLPDFRAFERTFQLVAQVAGRAGRGNKPGRVVVQTFAPEHYSIVLAARHDFETFAEREMRERETAGYPPFTRAMRLVFSGLRENEVEAAGEEAARRLQEVAPAGVRLLGPAPCFLPMLRLHHRWQVLALAPEVGMIRYLVRCLEPFVQATRRVDVTLDVDPFSVF
ncbi:MAG: primosomal protein N' [Planctomycetes bacterium]|nr:primosomal protein N' [Planctomycetota bacterium]